MSAFDGGNAFPVALENNTSNSITGFHGETLEPGSRSVYGGMSLRDYFAAKVITGLQPVYWDTVDKYDTPEQMLECMAQSAYEIADAMLAERAK